MPLGLWQQNPLPETSMPRQLQLHDPRVVGHYNALLHQQFLYHEVYDKLSALQNKASTLEWTSANTDQYNELNRIIAESMLYAE